MLFASAVARRTFAAAASGGRLPKGTTIKSDPSRYTTIDFATNANASASSSKHKKEDKYAKFKTSSPPLPASPSSVTGNGALLREKEAAASKQQQRQQQLQETATSHHVPMLRVNEDIVGVKEARLINGETGETISPLLPFADCVAKARELGLDLIEVNKTPAVLKLANFSKMIEQRKEMRKKAQSLMGFKPSAAASASGSAGGGAAGSQDLDQFEDVKEVHMGTNIENHDFEMKRELMKKFLSKNHPIKLVLKFKKSTHLKADERPARARQLLERVRTELKEYIAPEDTKQKSKDLQGTIIKVFFPLLSATEAAAAAAAGAPKKPSN